MDNNLLAGKKKPEMILFDYGQTLVDEERFDGVKGTAEVMKYAVKNKYNRTPEQVQEEADKINRELGKFDLSTRYLQQTEIHNHPFNAYLYESQGIELSLSYEETEEIFWNGAAPGKLTEGIEALLKFLRQQGIRTGVISNISYSGSALIRRINRMLPSNTFEFILATSEYVFRKPNPRIFNLALEKAELSPEQVFYVGDKYECDIVGAKGAGLFPVWYTACCDEWQRQNLAPEMEGGQTGGGKVDMKGVLQVGSWRELREYLAELE